MSKTTTGWERSEDGPITVLTWGPSGEAVSSTTMTQSSSTRSAWLMDWARDSAEPSPRAKARRAAAANVLRMTVSLQIERQGSPRRDGILTPDPAQPGRDGHSQRLRRTTGTPPCPAPARVVVL